MSGQQQLSGANANVGADAGWVGLGNHPITRAVRFVDEHGTHVIRSTEFDVYGEGDTFSEALRDFCGHLLALMEYLSELVDQNEATEDELRMSALLGSRLASGQEALLRQLDSKTVVEALLDAALPFRQRGRRERLDWQTHHTDSSGLLPV